MARGRVLLIDDDAWVGRLLQLAMGEAGFDVAIATSAEEGRARAVELAPDCVVCDVDLPDRSGFWVAERVRSEPEPLGLVPVVFLSGLDDRESRQRGLAAGGDAYLAKPIRVDDVVTQVDALIHMAARFRGQFPVRSAWAERSVALTGDLTKVSIGTVLAMLDLEHRSGTLEVRSPERSAAIALVAGEVARAEIDGRLVPPLDALQAIVRWNSGRFAFVANELASSYRGGRIRVPQLLLEAAQRVDEEHAPTASALRDAPTESVRIGPNSGRHA
jgi:two-component system OmpR family response regulator